MQDEYSRLTADLVCGVHKSADEEIALGYDRTRHLRLRTAQFIRYHYTAF